MSTADPKVVTKIKPKTDIPERQEMQIQFQQIKGMP
jgi:hypothetical protein